MARKKKEEKIGLPRAKPNRRERETSHGPYGGTVPRNYMLGLCRCNLDFMKLLHS